MWPFSRKGPSGFSSSSTAEEVTQGIDGTGLVAIITGASSGIGSETARVLALRGVHVVMGVRKISSGNQIREAILKEKHTAKVDVLELDLSSMASVKKFSSEFHSMNLPLNILINNAGVMGIPFTLSEDGIEMHFATNYIGHFLLTHLLVEKMKDTARSCDTEGRIINVASELHRRTYKEGIQFDKINSESEYQTYLAYGQSKLANILHANELSRRSTQEGARLTANSVHPGVIVTNILRNENCFVAFIAKMSKMLMKSIPQGAATSCYVALHPQVKGVTGKYFSDSNVGSPSSKSSNMELAKRLWEFSMETVSPWL